jgi:hypothetical protein
MLGSSAEAKYTIASITCFDNMEIQCKHTIKRTWLIGVVLRFFIFTSSRTITLSIGAFRDVRFAVRGKQMFELAAQSSPKRTGSCSVNINAFVNAVFSQAVLEQRTRYALVIIFIHFSGAFVSVVDVRGGRDERAARESGAIDALVDCIRHDRVR